MKFEVSNLPSPAPAGSFAPPMGFFKDRQPLRLRLTLDADDRATATATAAATAKAKATVQFTVRARCAHGGWSRWRLVETLAAVPVEAGGAAETAWQFRDWEQFNRWAFADFRFEAQIHFTVAATIAVAAAGNSLKCWKAMRPSTPTLRSAVWRHYAGAVGWYGFGPIGERFSNSEVRRVARETGAAAIRFRQREALRRMAGQVAPGERGMRLYGYSLGGRAAVGWARWLGRRGVGVEWLFGIDPVDLAARQIVVPANVRRAVSCYQRNGARLPLLVGPAGRGLPFAAADPARTAVENRCIDLAPDGGWAVMHEDAPRVVSAEVAAMLRLPPDEAGARGEAAGAPEEG